MDENIVAELAKKQHNQPAYNFAVVVAEQRRKRRKERFDQWMAGKRDNYTI